MYPIATNTYLDLHVPRLTCTVSTQNQETRVLISRERARICFPQGLDMACRFRVLYISYPYV